MKDYYDEIFNLGETLFKSIIKIYNLDITNSKVAIKRQKTLSTLRFNYIVLCIYDNTRIIIIIIYGLYIYIIIISY